MAKKVQSTLSAFFVKPSDTVCNVAVKNSAEVVDMCQNILDGIITSMLAKPKVHDGSKLTAGMKQEWKKMFPWLEIVDNHGDTRLRCILCSKHTQKGVFGAEGSG